MNEFLTLFTRASKLLRSAADEAMSRHGVRVGQHTLLAVLWEDDVLTPGELAGRLHVSTPTVVKSASRMAAAGLLTRLRDPADARLVRLYLTPQAHAVRTVIEEEQEQLARRATASLSDEERRHVVSALKKIIAEFTGGEAGAEAGDQVP